MRMIRIESEGTGATTKIIDVESGENLAEKYPITSVSWSVDAQGMATVIMKLAKVQLRVIGQFDERSLDIPG